MDFHYQVIPDSVRGEYRGGLSMNTEATIECFLEDKNEMIQGVEKLLNSVDLDAVGNADEKLDDLADEIRERSREDFSNIFDNKAFHVDVDRLIKNRRNGYVRLNDVIEVNDRTARTEYRRIMGEAISCIRSHYIVSNHDLIGRFKNIIPRLENAMKNQDSLDSDAILELARDIYYYCRAGILIHQINDIDTQEVSIELIFDWAEGLVNDNSFVV